LTAFIDEVRIISPHWRSCINALFVAIYCYRSDEMRRMVGRRIALFFFLDWINATARVRLVLELASLVPSEMGSLCMIQEERN